MVCMCLVCKYRGDQIPRRSFHRVPPNEEQRKKWLEILGKSNDGVGSRAIICSRHFEESCFRYGLIYGRRLLKEGSLPSLYLERETVGISLPHQREHDYATVGDESCKVSDCATVELKSRDESCEVSAPEIEQSCPKEISKKRLFASKNKYLTIEFKDGDVSCKAPMIKIEQYFPEEEVGEIIRDPPISSENSSASKCCVFESRRLLYLKGKMDRQKKQIASLNRQVRKLRRDKITLKSQVKQLKKENAQHDKETRLRNARMGPIPSALFSQLQSKKKKVSSYPLPLRVFASTMSFLSANAYKYLRSIFPSLPHAATLRKWYSAIDIKPGTCKAALDILREKYAQANKIGKKLICNVTVDNMVIRKLVTYNGKEYTGFVTYDNTGQRNIENRKQKSAFGATEAIVIMVICLNEDWKIPVAYHFIDGLCGENRAKIVSECLGMLHPTGINVVSLTFDGGSSNIKMIESLGATFSDTDNFNLSFPHPITEEPIFIIFDACHAIKLVRNTLEGKKILLEGDKNTIEWSYFEKLVIYQHEYGLHSETKITKRHINFASEKMNVKLATPLLSSSVSNAMNFLRTTIEMPEFSNSLGTEKFCVMMNDIFNLLNSRQAFSKVPIKSAINRNNIEEIKSRVMKYENYIKSLYDNEVPILSSDRGLGFYGLLVSMRSSISIFEKYALENEAPLEYLLTYKLSHDHLELFFSSVRSRGGNNNNPTSDQFESAFKWLLVCAMDVV